MAPRGHFKLNMIDSYIPVENYEFDAQQMLLDYQKIQNEFPGKSTYFLTLLTQEAAESMTALYDSSYIRKLYPPEAFKDMDALYKANCEKMSMDTFHSFMKGTYTHALLMAMDADLREKGKRITSVLFHNLFIGKCYPMHSDMMETRFHIPITTNKHAFFMVEKDHEADDYHIGRMETPGKVYELVTEYMHTAINSGMEDRIHLLIDYKDI